MSKSNGNYLGNFSDISAYSLSMGKLASSGQGGFITTNNKKYYSIFNRIKNNGLKNNFETNWSNFGLNFKYTDIQASFVIPQIERIKKNIEKIKKNYEFMYDKIKEMKHISLVESKVKDGEIPLYFECFSKKSKKIKKLLLKSGIPIRNAYPSLNKFKRFNNTDEFPNSKYFEKNTFFLPSGIDVKKNLKAIIITLKKIDRNL
jgi:perosamine synthetase